MPINVYTGLMRSGKSFEVVSNPICEAIAQGRRVVTNVDGISNDLVRAYVAKTKKLDIEKLGHVVHVVNEDVFKPDFFPYFDDHRGEHIDTIVQPGDLVAIDEAWRFWGSDSKIHRHHKSFFLEHGHFTHPVTGVACDLVLMIQDMATLHRSVRAVIAFSFRTHKKVSLGMGNTYSVTMWEGPKQVRTTEIGNWVRRYNEEIFPLYSSFKGGADGKTVNIDKRQNIFSGKRIWIVALICIVGGGFAMRNIWKFFHPVDLGAQVVKTEGVDKDKKVPGAALPARPVVSDIWRVAGSLGIAQEGFVVLVDTAGRVRLVRPYAFQNGGLLAAGEVDGEKVTTYSGHAAPVVSAFGDKK